MKKAGSVHRFTLPFWPSLAGAAWLVALWLVGDASPVRNATVAPLLSEALADDQSRELSMITGEYPPGGSNPVHTHRGQALTYVLEGSIVMQLRDGSSMTLTPGQTFYEGPEDVHVVSRNASHTATARFLVFLVQDKDAPILTPVD